MPIGSKFKGVENMQQAIERSQEAAEEQKREKRTMEKTGNQPPKAEVKDVPKRKEIKKPEPAPERPVVGSDIKPIKEEDAVRDDPWVFDPSFFLTEENINKIDISDDDVMNIYLGSGFKKEVKINDKFSATFRTMTKQENDDIDSAVMGDANRKFFEAAKEAEILTLAKVLVSINDTEMPEENEKRVERLQNIPNTLFRVIWIWYIIFEKAIQKAVLGEDALKKSLTRL